MTTPLDQTFVYFDTARLDKIAGIPEGNMVMDRVNPTALTNTGLWRQCLLITFLYWSMMPVWLRHDSVDILPAVATRISATLPVLVMPKKMEIGRRIDSY